MRQPLQNVLDCARVFISKELVKSKPDCDCPLVESRPFGLASFNEPPTEPTGWE
jgi:hypothetical protein